MTFLQRWQFYGLSAAIAVFATVPHQAAERTRTDPCGRPLYEPGKIAMKLRPEAAPISSKALPHRFGIASLDAISEELGVRRVAPMFRTRSNKARRDLPDLTRIYLVRVPEGVNVSRAAVLFARSPVVEYAEPLPIFDLADTPDDPMFYDQNFLPQIMAEAAWDVHKGEEGAEVVVGTAETGVQWRHRDLVDNIYQNLGEDLDGDGRVIERSGTTWVFDPGDVNGIDDDGNGYPDDFIGWNFFNDDGGEDNDPNDRDRNSHGTGTAGLIAACTDNSDGIASISWNVKILPTSSQNPSGFFSLAANLRAWVYLAENGVDVIYSPLAGSRGPRTRLIQEVTEYVRGLGTFLVAPAGPNLGSEPGSPASLPGVVSVTNAMRDDSLYPGSNFGISVDLTAPGTNILSTKRGGYSSTTGPCNSAALVTGVFALVKSLHPDWSSEQLIQRVLATADNIDEVNPDYAGQLGHGRVNAFRALTEEVTPPPELRLAVQGTRFADDSGDGTVGAGEGVDVFATVRNYSHMPGSQALTLTLSAESPLIDVVDSTIVVGMATDTEEELGEAFTIRVDADAPSGFYDLSLTAQAMDADISPLSVLEMTPLLVANGGFLVWEGFQRSSFSGRYLRDELQARGFEVVYGHGEFPGGMVGFDGVFLSFGNNGPPLWETIPRLDADWKVESIRRYLESAGRLYLEGGDTLGYDVYNIVDGEALAPLFGLESAVDGHDNDIDSLDGHADALTEGMHFNESSQEPMGLIDLFTPGAGEAAFTESDYGIVAVQHEGSFGQRTFCFSYALADLVDGSTTRSRLLDSIIVFFGLNLEDESGPLIRRAGRRVKP